VVKVEITFSGCPLIGNPISIEIPQEAAGNKEVESKLDEKLKTYKTDWVFEKYKYREK
jgi:hypothetical protein